MNQSMQQFSNRKGWNDSIYDGFKKLPPINKSRIANRLSYDKNTESDLRNNYNSSERAESNLTHHLLKVNNSFENGSDYNKNEF